ncbi:hypothetical protein [Streptomyces sp. LN245]|uniref:hypothetical protein n=1 Tax=Streptomyces sp. LN245 TaxID=3112975 RepID=UPI00371B0A77
MTAPTTKEWLRAAVDRIALGSTRLVTHHAGRALRAVTARVSRWPWWVQLGLAALALRGGLPAMTALGAWVHRKASAGSSWLFIAAALWLLAAYRAGHPDWKPKGTDEPEPSAPGEDDEDQEQEQPGSAREQPRIPTVEELREALAKVGTPHAHLAALATELGIASEQVREALDRCGVTVEAVRMRGRGSSTGVKGDALPASTAPPERVVAAGQPANNDNNNGPAAPLEKGTRVESIGQGGRLVHATADVNRHHTVSKS